MNAKAINPWTWQDRLGFSQAIEVSGVQRILYCAGQTSVDDAGNPVAVGDMAGQIGQALTNLERVLGEAGFGLKNVVRLNYYTTDVDGFGRAAGVLGKRLAEAGCKPSATLLGVARLFHPDILVEIEATAVS
jgi:enamine deaminase RidA (YjgF/YER057c/UK114 family)